MNDSKELALKFCISCGNESRHLIGENPDFVIYLSGFRGLNIFGIGKGKTARIVALLCLDCGNVCFQCNENDHNDIKRLNML